LLARGQKIFHSFPHVEPAGNFFLQGRRGPSARQRVIFRVFPALLFLRNPCRIYFFSRTASILGTSFRRHLNHRELFSKKKLRQPVFCGKNEEENPAVNHQCFYPAGIRILEEKFRPEFPFPPAQKHQALG